MTPSAPEPARATTRTAGVIITATSALIVRWSPGVVWRSRIHGSAAEDHATPRRSPSGQPVNTKAIAAERRRLFFAQVIHVLSREEELLLLGDREVVAEFAARLSSDDLVQGRVRRVEVRSSGPLSDRQLLSRVRAFAGQPARSRRTASRPPSE